MCSEMLLHSGCVVRVWLRRQGFQPGESCSSRDEWWRALGPRSVMLHVWGKAGSCGWCREQFYQIEPQRWCWRCSTAGRPARHGFLQWVKGRLRCPQWWQVGPSEGHAGSFPGMKRSSVLSRLSFRWLACVLWFGCQRGGRKPTVGCRWA